MGSIKKSCLIIPAFMIITASFLCLSGYAQTRGNKVFSLDLSRESLPGALEQISRKSGYEIWLSGPDGDYQISLKLKDVSIQEALSRVLARINHAMTWDTGKKKVTVYLFDNARPGKATAPASSTARGFFPTPPGSPGTGSQQPAATRADMEPSSSGAATVFIQGTPTGNFDP